MLMTLLSNQKLNQLIINYEHQALSEKSRTYALSAFSNLIFARNRFEDEINAGNKLYEANTLSLNFGQKNVAMFDAITEILPDGSILSSQQIDIPASFLQRLNTIKPNVIHLTTWPNKPSTADYSVNLVLRQVDRNIATVSINPRYMWGESTDYPSNLRICAYQFNNTVKTKLFCSSDHPQQTQPSPINQGVWTLFLAGEFHNNPWLFETTRLDPITPTDLKDLVGSKAYISIAVLSLLVIGLLSLIQIRKTMVPLEQLIKGTKQIAEGDFVTVKVDGDSEFSALAAAFNTMSTHIKKQLNTLQSFSKIDIEQLTELVINRMQTLKPDAIILIANVENQSISCNVTALWQRIVYSIPYACLSHQVR